MNNTQLTWLTLKSVVRQLAPDRTHLEVSCNEDSYGGVLGN
jgi:hypothetical protein